MAARPPMPARRVVVPPPPKAAPVPASAEDHAEEAGDDGAVAVVKLSRPLRQLGQVFRELRFEREPTYAELKGFPGGLAIGMTTHCTELAMWLVPKLCPPIKSSTLDQLASRDVMQITGVVVGFWTGSPTTGVSPSAPSPSDSAGALTTPSA